MSATRLRFALDQTTAGDWQKFERLALAFLGSEFADLRPTASPSGDRGRDAELFSPDGLPFLMFQISVSGDWRSKIHQTVARIRENFPDVRLLTYVTSRQIGADSDDLKKSILESHGIVLDTRDREWLVMRYASAGNPSVEKFADDYAKQIVDPLLEEKGIASSKSVVLSSEEEKSALLYLELQIENDSREKGLTKLCFDALVRSVLRDSNSENRLKRAEVLNRIHALLPSHDESRLDELTNSALGRLTRKAIRHWTKDDEFCLSHEEREFRSLQLAEIETENIAFTDEVAARVTSVLSSSELKKDHPLDHAVRMVRIILETFLFDRGESFARALQHDNLIGLSVDLTDQVAEKIVSTHASENSDSKELRLMVEIAHDLMVNPSQAIITYIHRLSRAYTLFAFLRETPDVQVATKKLFSRGEIWLDASIILPIFAESLLDPADRSLSKMLRGAREAGNKLFVTTGVLEEVSAHIRICRAFNSAVATGSNWRGRVPFLVGVYTVNNRTHLGFASWIARFAGEGNTVQDIADYLEELFGVEVASLEAQVREADDLLRNAVSEAWIAVHEARRKKGDDDFDPHMILRLAGHDTENYLGVLQKRKNEVGKSILGRTIWWLTLDGAAWQVARAVREVGGIFADTPLMSADFLLNYLMIGPARGRLSKEVESSLPVSISTKVDDVPIELIEVAARIRSDFPNEPDRIIKRRIRDALESIKARRGDVAMAGIGGMEKRLGLSESHS